MGASSRTTPGYFNCIETISGLPAGLLIPILCADIGAAELVMAHAESCCSNNEPHCSKVSGRSTDRGDVQSGLSSKMV